MVSLLQPSELQTLFDQFDRNRDGRIDLDELRTVLELVGVDASWGELEKIVGAASFNLVEFSAICEGMGNGDDAADYELMEAFKVFDENGDGFISGKELKRVLVRLGLWKEEDGDCKRMICKFDANADGRLDFQEFKDMMLRSL